MSKVYITRRVIKHLEGITGLLLVETQRRNEFQETRRQPPGPSEAVMERQSGMQKRGVRANVAFRL